MKKILAGLALLSLVLGVALPVLAATEDYVSATVEPKLVAVSVDDGSVDYGVLDFSATKSTVDLGDTQVITNDSNVNAKMDVKSSDAVGGAVNWDLVDEASIATDDFGHHYSIDSGAFTDFPEDNSYAADVVTFDKSGGADDTADLDIKIFMPTDSTDAAGAKTITVTVLVHE